MRPVAMDVVAATSAHAFTALPKAWLRLLRQGQPPVHVVGKRTAETARGLGLTDVVAGPGDGVGLVEALLQVLPLRGHVLYLAGRPRKPLLEEALASANHAVEVLEVYEARPLAQPPEALVDALGALEDIAVLHFSRASAEGFRCAGLEGGAWREGGRSLESMPVAGCRKRARCPDAASRRDRGKTR